MAENFYNKTFYFFEMFEESAAVRSDCPLSDLNLIIIDQYITITGKISMIVWVYQFLYSTILLGTALMLTFIFWEK